MNIGKDTNNQSSNEFDDVTFDDMTFDDEPLQSEQINSNQEDMITQQTYEQPQQTYGQVQQVNQQAIADNKKAKKLKKEKAPKQSKAPKTPKTPKQPRKNKVKNQNNAVTNGVAGSVQFANGDDTEVTGKKPNLKVIIPVAVAAVAVIAGAVVINLPKNTDKHIVLATNTPVVNEQEQDNSAAVNPVKDSSSDKNTETTEVKNTETENNNPSTLALNKPMKIGVVVNTKLDGETEYSDHDAYLVIEYSNFVSGYDNVKTYLDEYNETATNKVNLPDKDDFYASSVGNDLVMYEVSITVPDDFPTNDAKHGYTGLNPEFSFEIKGTDKEDALITKLYEFAIPSIYYIGSDTSDFVIGNTYKLRYMTTMPMGLQANDYAISLIYSNDGKDEKYNLQSVEIPSNQDVVEITGENTLDTSENDIDTETSEIEQTTE